ncbi:polysaccharide biosynthesis tyrosine autokinase [Acidobacteria bacterium AB60]|nr:polysaccharide biosynthesis tyrosine autokinase [Acidobacteria bacterium AB60]
MAIEPQSEHQLDRVMINPATIAAPSESLSLMDVWRVVMKQRFVILAVTIISFAAATVYSFRTKSVYESGGRLQINPNVPKVGLQGYGDQERSSADTSAIQTELLILQSDSVLLQTAEKLDIYGRLRAGEHATPGSIAQYKLPVVLSPVERRALIGYIRGGLSVKLVGGTQMVDIRYRNHDPKLATDVVNTLMDTFIHENLRSKFDQTKQTSAWLEKQLEDLKEQAADAQIRLANFQKQHNIVGTDENSNLTIQKLGQTSSDLESAEADRIMRESRMREFASQDTDMAALTGDNPQVAALRTQLADLQTQRDQLALEVGPRHPKMQAMNAQIAKVKVDLDHEVSLAHRQIQDEYQGALRTEQLLRQRLDAQKEEAFRLNEDVGQYAILRHEAELNRDLYDTLQMRLKEASVTAGLSATNISVVDPAQVPIIPIAPRKTMSMLFGLIGGFVGGLVMAFIIESIDDRMQTSEEVESVSTLASLATIPHMEDGPLRRKRPELEDGGSSAQVRQLTALHSPKSLAGEAYRGLRSSLLLSSIDKPPRVIAITSAFPGEGKTTTAVNCALALAQRGERVLLVDADLRRGTLHQVFRINDRSFGLSSVLSHPEERRMAPNPVPELPQFHILPTGMRPPNPAEMLSSQRMEEQLHQWTRDYDRIVLDTAPILAVSDTQALAVMADAVVLVVRAGVTRKRAILRARDLLWRINAKIAGVVVNDVDMRLENFYTYRYGMYGYRYGYGYSYAQPYSTTPEEAEEKEKSK